MAVRSKKKKRKLHELRHPEFQAWVTYWKKWWLCYEGGEDFREEYLKQYSRREDTEDFKRRKELTYIPGHARSAINIIRNAMAVQLPDVVRNGSQEYMDAMEQDVDTFQSSMSSFVSIELLPRILVQSKVYVVVDAPEKTDGATRADDLGRPYLFMVAAENMLSWAYGDDGTISAALMQLWEDETDKNTGLVVGSCKSYRYYRFLGSAEETFKGAEDEVAGPGVLVWECDKDGKETMAPVVLDLPRVPIAEFRSVASLMSEIADHQISLLNLASTDMDFLWRGNFPIYTEQQSGSVTGIRPRGTKERQDGEDIDDETTVDGREPGTGKNSRQRRLGTGQGLGYKEGLERPSFIAPDVKNLEASMKKQDALAQEIRVLVNLSLTSLSVRALEQSGKSKEADRVGEEAGLAYLGRVLESGEREIAKIWALMEGSDSDATDVKYPQSYSLKTDEERQEEAGKLRKLHSSVRSAAFQRAIDQRVADILLRPITTPEELKTVFEEIAAAPFVDDDKERGELIQKDAAVGLCSKSTGSVMRGYPEDEQAKVTAERQSTIAEMTGGPGGGEGAG